MKEFYASCLGLRDAMIRFASEKEDQKPVVQRNLEKTLDNIRYSFFSFFLSFLK